MFGHVKVHDLTPVMSKNDEDEQYSEGGRGNREKVNGHKIPNVVIEK